MGDGMWDEEDQASNDNKKRERKKNICILIQEQFVHIWIFFLCLPSFALALFIISAFASLQFILLCTNSQYSNVPKSAFKLFLAPPLSLPVSLNDNA